MSFLIKENIKVFGEYRFEGYDIYTGAKVCDKTYKNVVTQLYFNALYGLMKLTGGASDIGLTYFSTGDDDTTALKSDTLLGNELFRKSITSITNTTRTVVAKTVLAPSDSVFTIKEVGVWAEGSLSLDSGTLISHANVNISKNASTQYNVTYTFTIE